MNNITWPAVFQRYHYFLIDIWGVLIDGETCYPKALTFLSYLGRLGKLRLLVSNTPMLTENLAQHLTQLKLTSNYYDGLLTSGQVTRDYLQQATSFRHRRAYYYIGPDETRSLLYNTVYKQVSCLSQADFLLVTGIPDEPTDIAMLLVQAKQKNLPLLCCNPDQSIRRLSGQRLFCAGSIAKQYQALSGKVIYIGKPYPLIYRMLFAKFTVKKPQTLFIGDSVATDIYGAKQQGIDCMLANNDYTYDNDDVKPTYHEASLTQ